MDLLTMRSYDTAKRQGPGRAAELTLTKVLHTTASRRTGRLLDEPLRHARGDPARLSTERAVAVTDGDNG
jgi:hypothetical protein